MLADMKPRLSEVLEYKSIAKHKGEDILIAVFVGDEIKGIVDRA